MSETTDLGRWLEENRICASVKMRTQRTFYFHGGIPGLKPGDILLPPIRTGTDHTLSNYSADQFPPESHLPGKRRDSVYCSMNPFLSSRFAATYPDGALYMVNPHLPMEPDPYVPAISLSVTCPAATVVAVVAPKVPMASQPKVIEEVLRERAAGTMNGLHCRALDAMRKTGLLESGMTADDWAGAQGAPPSRLDLAELVRRTVDGLSPDDRDRYSNPARRVALSTAPDAASRYIMCHQGHRHWGAFGAAGLLLVHTGRDGVARYLMQLRSRRVHHGSTWALPGGAQLPGETPYAGALREASEEMGLLPPIRPRRLCLDDHGGWAYITLIADVAEQFQPTRGDGEGAGYRWCTDAEARGLALHPGLAFVWPSLVNMAVRC